MSSITRCDRCGKLNDHARPRHTLYAYITDKVSDKRIELGKPESCSDLCGACTSLVIDFFTDFWRGL